jgi:hypothetical protein
MVSEVDNIVNNDAVAREVEGGGWRLVWRSKMTKEN